jgi:hypothetical protein
MRKFTQPHSVVRLTRYFYLWYTGQTNVFSGSKVRLSTRWAPELYEGAQGRQYRRRIASR